MLFRKSYICTWKLCFTSLYDAPQVHHDWSKDQGGHTGNDPGDKGVGIEKEVHAGSDSGQNQYDNAQKCEDHVGKHQEATLKKINIPCNKNKMQLFQICKVYVF